MGSSTAAVAALVVTSVSMAMMKQTISDTTGVGILPRCFSELLMMSDNPVSWKKPGKNRRVLLKLKMVAIISNVYPNHSGEGKIMAYLKCLSSRWIILSPMILPEIHRIVWFGPKIVRHS